jgi:dimeric dUTPase (all-alpha-NTP-PPase superfamily)
MTKNDLFHELLARQRRLDTVIIENYKKRVDWLEAPELYQKLSVALCVELAEFMNEMRVFKFWSLKTVPQDKDKAKEEFIDCLHFMLSLTNMVGMKVDDIPFGIGFSKQLNPSKLMQQYMSCIHCAVTIHFEPSMDAMRDLWVEFLTLCEHSGLFESHDDIYNCYMVKNRINAIRQEQGY